MNFPVLLGDERALIVRASTMLSIIARINSIFGPEGKSAPVLLHQVGEAAGQRAFESAKAVLGHEFIRKNVARTLGLFTAHGWGIADLKTMDLARKTAEVHIKDAFECAESGNDSTVAQCHFIRGLLTGWFSKLLERKIDVTETQCAAKGDPLCAFQIHPFKG